MKAVRRVVVAVGVDLDPIAGEVVAPRGEGDDLVGLAVEGPIGQVEGVVVIEDLELGLLGGG
ncbi:MAG: hypothetical protein R3E12_02120 [Candidatus Eisenbacteria bacterium]